MQQLVLWYSLLTLALLGVLTVVVVVQVAARWLVEATFPRADRVRPPVQTHPA